MPLSPAQKIKQAETDARVMELVARGMSYRQIAKLGIENVSHASQVGVCVERATKAMKSLPAETYRKVENEKLDGLERRMQALLAREDLSENATIRAVQTLVSVAKRRADLNGLDAPVVIDAIGGVQTVFVDTRVLTKSRSEPDV